MDQSTDSSSQSGDPIGIVSPRLDVNPGYPSDADVQALTNTAPVASAIGSFASNLLSYTASGTAQSSYYYNSYNVLLTVELFDGDGDIVNSETDGDGIETLALLAYPRTSNLGPKTLLTLGRTCGLGGKAKISGYTAVSAWKDGYLAVYKTPIAASSPQAGQPSCPTEEEVFEYYLCDGIAQDNPTDCDSEENGGSNPGGGGGGAPQTGCYQIWRYDTYVDEWPWDGVYVPNGQYRYVYVPCNN